jgi:hypothetical protein
MPPTLSEAKGQWSSRETRAFGHEQRNCSIDSSLRSELKTSHPLIPTIAITIATKAPAEMKSVRVRR